MKVFQKATMAFMLLAVLFCSQKAHAQVNAQLFHDFGSDRKFETLTIEMFKQDKWVTPISLSTTISTTTSIRKDQTSLLVVLI